VISCAINSSWQICRRSSDSPTIAAIFYRDIRKIVDGITQAGAVIFIIGCFKKGDEDKKE